jgi:hypothetical protein
MKKSVIILIMIISLLMGNILNAQNVGIGSTSFTPDASAGLDVNFTDKGLLIPRVALTNTSSTSPITSPANSLLVYNTATAGDVTPGYYYWDGSQWVRFATGTIASGLNCNSPNYLIKSDGSSGVCTDIIENNNRNIGIGATPNDDYKLYLYRPGTSYGANKTGIYSYRYGASGSTNGGTSWSNTGIDAAIKGYSFWGNEYTAAIAGYSYLDYVNSVGVIGSNSLGTVRAELATRSYTYDGSTDNALYSLKLTGDFYNQEISYGQSSTPYFTGDFLLRTVNITTHGTGIDKSIVWIHGECDYYKTGENSHVCFYIYRDGTLLCEISEISFVGEDKTVHIQWMDEPPAGDHTYELRVYYPVGGMTYYGHQLHVVELKR